MFALADSIDSDGMYGDGGAGSSGRTSDLGDGQYLSPVHIGGLLSGAVG